MNTQRAMYTGALDAYEHAIRHHDPIRKRAATAAHCRAAVGAHIIASCGRERRERRRRVTATTAAAALRVRPSALLDIRTITRTRVWRAGVTV